MSMPNHLILIRHGESAGNVAGALAKQGDESHFTEEFVTTPARTWALTEKGRLQAETAGFFVRELLEEFGMGAVNDGRYYVSPFVRTHQTAGHLGLTYLNSDVSVQWRENRSIRERGYGEIATVPHRVFREAEHYKLSAATLDMDPMYWRPPGGESFADVMENRVRNFLDTLHRECSGRIVVGVSHGEFINATRMVLERLTDDDYTAWRGDASQRINNCEVVHYSRITPSGFKGAGEESGRLAWVRRAYPLVEGDGSATMVIGMWRRFDYVKLTNEDLIHA